VAALAMREFLRMCLPPERKPEQLLCIILAFVLTLVVGFAAFDELVALLVLGFLLLSSIFLFRFKELTTVISHLSLILLGMFYIPLLLGHMILLHDYIHGKAWIFFVMFLVMASDSCAYFSGISFGKHKLYPAISPNKSIEGAVGGLLGGVFAAWIVHLWFFPELTLLDCVFLGAGLGAVSQIGDLFESMLKRSYDVKDSGTLIPGHGGILDRLDSLLFAYPLAYYYAYFLI